MMRLRRKARCFRKKVKKDKGGSASGQNAKPEANTVPAAPRVKPELPLPVMMWIKAEGNQGTCSFSIQ
ncbi:hypothetical protein CR513_28203, partial [Mucuna pruriens]